MARGVSVAVLCVVVAMVTMTAAGGDVSEEARLRGALAKDYDKNARPLDKQTISMMTFRILALDMHEDKHIMEALTWFGYTWYDPRLTWNKADYGGLDRLAMDPGDVWRPDLSLYNGAVNQHLPESNLPVLAMSSGKMMHVPALNLAFTCAMDLTYWPHDTHNCTIMVGSWVHHGHMVDIQVNGTEPKVTLASLGDGRGGVVSWLVSDVALERSESYYECCLNPYINLEVSMLVTRDAPAFAWIVKAPLICMSLLTMVVFLLPPQSEVKLTFGGLCLVLDALFIAYTAIVVGHNPSHTPLIVQLVVQQVVVVAVGVVVSAVVVRMARDPHRDGLPRPLFAVATTLGPHLGLTNYTNNALSPRSLVGSGKADEVELGEEAAEGRRESRHDQEWLLLAALLDRLALLIYLAICVITLIRFTSIL